MTPSVSAGEMTRIPFRVLLHTIIQHIYHNIQFPDILNNTRFDPMEVFLGTNLRYYVFNDEGKKQFMKEGLSSKDVQIETRAQYPSDKVTLKRVVSTKNKVIRWFDLRFEMNGNFDVDIFFEDSTRKSVADFKYRVFK